MVKVLIGAISTLFIIFIIPFVIYGIFSNVFGIKTPEGVSPSQFLISVLISKIGVAIAITLLFYFSKNIFYEKWLLYVFIWWLMFVFSEVGQAVGPNYSWNYAIAGVISETIYFPLSVYILRLIIK
jgi:hypothetical protein